MIPRSASIGRRSFGSAVIVGESRGGVGGDGHRSGGGRLCRPGNVGMSGTNGEPGRLR